MIRRTRRLVYVLLLTPLVCARVRAQELTPGDGQSALPAIVRVGVPDVGDRRFTLALDGGYGYLEAMHAAGAAQRTQGQVSLGARVVDWLALSLGAEARHDFAPREATSSVDATSVTQLGVRISDQTSRSARLGIELRASMPGGTGLAPVPRGTSFEGRVLSAFVLGSRTLLATSLGLRLDQSAHAIGRAATLTPGDRIALGASDFNAMLLGLGISHRVGVAELLCELSADMLVGTNAQLLASSPLRADLGARFHFGPSVQLEVLLNSSLSARPGLSAADPLVAVEPRIGGSLGLRLSWPGRRARAEAAASPPSVARPQAAMPPASGRPASPAESIPASPAESISATADGAAPAAAVATPEPEAPAEETTGESPAPSSLAQLRGHVRAFSGKPLVATVTVYPRHLQADTDEQGYFQLDIPPGRYTVRLRSHGYKSQSRKVDIQADSVTVLNVELGKK
jgi:hypothetical protein